jgi:O-antigen/teichoic acid export membrane protein
LSKQKKKVRQERGPFEPDYSIPKEKLPEDWIQAREKMERKGYAVFHVRKWYFPVLVALTFLLFALGLITWSLEISAFAGALTLLLYYWNRRAEEGKTKPS